MKKRYILLHSMSLTTSFLVNGQSVMVAFGGGFDSADFKKNGSFVTTDKAMQDAIEGDASYGKKFILEGEQPKAKVVEEIFDDQLFTKVQECREYLLAKIEGLTEDDIPNKAKIIEIGLNKKIRFLKLK